MNLDGAIKSAVISTDTGFVDDYRITGTAGSREFKLVVAKKTADFDQVLSTIINWTTTDNHAKCMVKKISLCMDNVACSSTPSLPTSEAIRISPAGTVSRQTQMESLDSSTIEPRLIIKRDTPTTPELSTIYIKGEIPQATIQKFITLKLVICGMPISLVNDAIVVQNKDNRVSAILQNTDYATSAGEYIQEIDVIDYVGQTTVSGEKRDLKQYFTG